MFHLPNQTHPPHLGRVEEKGEKLRDSVPARTKQSPEENIDRMQIQSHPNFIDGKSAPFKPAIV